MPLISRQYHPHSCSLEITAQTSPLSRWAGRPILKSVHFLLSFRELSGQNHEPLEIRGNHEQLQRLSATVTNYVQTLLGQSLVHSPTTTPAEIAAAADQGTEPTTDAAASLYLRPRSLVTHDLGLGELSTNAEHPTVSLKVTQLFDLVSALDDCAAELEVLPLASPRRRPAIPVWASSAAVLVLMLGVSTATLQLTQQNPAAKREGVTSEDQQDTNGPTPNPAAEGIASAPKGSATTKPFPPTSASPTSRPPSLGSTPATQAEQSDLETSVEQQQNPPSNGTSSSRPEEALAPSATAKPQGNRPTVPNRSTTPPPTDQELISQRRGSPRKRLRDPIAVSPPPAASKGLRPQGSSPAPAAAPPSRPAAEPAPAITAETSVESDLPEADRLHGSREPNRSRHPLDQSSAGNVAESAYVAPQSAHAQQIRQYLSQRWQVPAGLTQPLHYQLTLNANGSLKQVKPLDKVATQYLAQVPLPAVNQPFIAPLKSAPTAQVRLVLKPDGTVQIVERVPVDKAP